MFSIFTNFLTGKRLWFKWSFSSVWRDKITNHHIYVRGKGNVFFWRTDPPPSYRIVFLGVVLRKFARFGFRFLLVRTLPGEISAAMKMGTNKRVENDKAHSPPVLYLVGTFQWRPAMRTCGTRIHSSLWWFGFIFILFFRFFFPISCL